MLSPNVDVCTRWNSTADMIILGLKMQAGIDLLFQNNESLKHLSLDEEEWLILKKVCKYLRYFKSLSTIFSGDKYVTLLYVIFGFNMLLDKLEESIVNLRSETSTVDKRILQALEAADKKLRKHYNRTHWIYCAGINFRSLI